MSYMMEEEREFNLSDSVSVICHLAVEKSLDFYGSLRLRCKTDLGTFEMSLANGDFMTKDPFDSLRKGLSLGEGVFISLNSEDNGGEQILFSTKDGNQTIEFNSYKNNMSFVFEEEVFTVQKLEQYKFWKKGVIQDFKDRSEQYKDR